VINYDLPCLFPGLPQVVGVVQINQASGSPQAAHTPLQVHTAAIFESDPPGGESESVCRTSITSAGVWRSQRWAPPGWLSQRANSAKGNSPVSDVRNYQVIETVICPTVYECWGKIYFKKSQWPYKYIAPDQDCSQVFLCRSILQKLYKLCKENKSWK